MSSTARNHYRSSGRVTWARFVPLAVIAVAVTSSIAKSLEMIARHVQDGRVRMIAAVFAVLAASGLLRLAISAGRCRNRGVAGLLGLVLAVVISVGPPYLGLMPLVGWKNAARTDLLTRFIGHHDVPLRLVGPTLLKRNTIIWLRREDAFMNWWTFAITAGLALWLCVVTAIRRAGRVYCERCQLWTEREASFFPAGSAATLAEALAVGSWSAAAVAALTPRASVEARERRYATAVLEYCKTTLTNTADGCPAYLSFGEAKFGGGISRTAQLDQMMGRAVVKSAMMSPSELPPLGRLFPSLSAKIRALDLSQVGSATPLASGIGAQVTAVPERYRGQILTRSVLIAGNVISLAGLALTFAFVGLAALAAFWGEAGRTRGLGDLPFSTPYAVAMGATAVCLTVLTGTVTLRNPSGLANRWIRARTGRLIDMRHDAIVRPSELGALFVEIVPRENWGRPMLDTATDIGYLLVDPRRREVRFEGDCERYQIPLDAIHQIDVAPAFAGAGTAGEVRYFMTVLQVRMRDGSIREFSMTPRATLIWGPKDHRERAARELAMSIRPETAGWMPRAFEVQPHPGA